MRQDGSAPLSDGSAGVGTSAARLAHEVAALRAVGLSADEAMLVAEHRLGAADPTPAAGAADGLRTAVLLAAAAGIAVHVVRFATDSLASRRSMRIPQPRWNEPLR